MARMKIAAGNWKMNTNFEEGLQLARDLSNANRPDDVLTLLAVPCTHLKSIIDQTLHVPNLEIAAQNFHHEKNGAYTGETSIGMLSSISAQYALIGHSERREYQRESNELLAQKVKLALEEGITPIFCCGEKLDIRKQGYHLGYVKYQLNEGLFHLSPEEFSKVIIAYEPVWAIGTGETASPQQAQEMHAEMRKSIARQYDQGLADDVSILYGGSVKPKNAKELFSQADVDGGLVGGASLKADSFLEIIHSF